MPERPKGADCKSAGTAYGGSNPPRPTTEQSVSYQANSQTAQPVFDPAGPRVRRGRVFPGPGRRLVGVSTAGDRAAAGKVSGARALVEQDLHERDIQPLVELAADLALDPHLAEPEGRMECDGAG